MAESLLFSCRAKEVWDELAQGFSELDGRRLYSVQIRLPRMNQGAPSVTAAYLLESNSLRTSRKPREVLMSCNNPSRSRSEEAKKRRRAGKSRMNRKGYLAIELKPKCPV